MRSYRIVQGYLQSLVFLTIACIGIACIIGRVLCFPRPSSAHLHHPSGAAPPAPPAFPQAWARSRAPLFAPRTPRFDRVEAACRYRTLPHAACLGAHTVANCWLQPQLHQTASEGRYCGARTFAAFSPMAPALPHTTKQCTRARRRPLLRLLPAEAQPRLCRSPLAAFCTETVQGTPWHRSRYPKQTVASNFQGTPNLYVDGTSCFLILVGHRGQV